MLKELYNKIALISPRVEVFLRKTYWSNISLLKKFNPHSATPKTYNDVKHVDFERVINWYRQNGIKEGDLLIVHSSFDGLQSTGLSPDQIIDRLLDLVGPSGTLAMPVIRYFKEEPKPEDLLKVSTDDLVCTYDVKRTPVVSGMLPFRLMRRKGAVISHHPFNPLCAIGPLADEMMKHNLDGDFPSPHGKYSAWRFAYDHHCKVVSLGVDIEHHNTIVHVNDESFDDWKWSHDEWFRHRTFDIVDEKGDIQRKIVSERKPKWGLLHFTDIRLNKDLKDLGIMKVEKIDGIIEVGFVDVDRFIPYLRSKKKTGYPYYV